MLSLFRAFAKSPIALAIILLLILGLVVTGSGGIFSGGGNAVILTGDQMVSVAEFRRAYDQEFRRIQDENPGITREEAEEMGLSEGLLQRLAVTSALEDKANKLGVAVSENTILQELRQIPAARNPVTGEFDTSTLNSALASMGLDPVQFGVQMESDLRRQQLIAPIAGGVTAPNSLARTRYEVAQERRRISALILDASGADEIGDPTDEEIQAFIDENPGTLDRNGLPLFTSPEMRAMTLVRFQLDDFIADVEVDEALLRETYDYQVETGRIGTPARRSVEQVSAPDAATARAVADRLAAGEDAAAIAQDLGLDVPVVQEDVESYEIPDTSVADAVFAMAEGESDAIEGRFGWVAVHVTGAEDADIPTFEDQRQALFDEAARADALEALYDQIALFEDARATGASLEEAAAQSGSPIEVFAPMDQYGRDASLAIDMARYTALGQEILPAAFEQVQGYPTDLTQFNDTDFYAMRVDEILPSAQRPLDDVRDEATMRWRQSQLDTQLSERADEALAQLQAGDALDIVALTAGGQAESTTIRRGETAANFGRNVVSRAFGLAPGEWAIVQAAAGRYAVVSVDEVIPADIAAASADELAELTGTLTQEMSNDVIASVQGALDAEYGLSGSAIDRRLFAIAMGRDPDAQQ